MATQFDGVAKEATHSGRGTMAKARRSRNAEGKNAVRLYFQWLALTLQRSSGTPVKDMLPSVVNYTKELLARPGGDGEPRTTPSNATRKRTMASAASQRKSNDGDVKKMHDNILNRPLGGSVVVQWLKLGEWVTVAGWEETPGNFDGIYEKIILPELRAPARPACARVLGHEDQAGRRPRREIEARIRASTNSTPSDSPRCSGASATDMAVLGFKNRAATEMFNLIQAIRTHPDAGDWMGQPRGDAHAGRRHRTRDHRPRRPPSRRPHRSPFSPWPRPSSSRRPRPRTRSMCRGMWSSTMTR